MQLPVCLSLFVQSITQQPFLAAFSLFFSYMWMHSGCCCLHAFVIQGGSDCDKCLRLHHMQKLQASSADSVCCRALHWVTIQMLCVSMDEEIPEVSENVVKAITGQSECLDLKRDCVSYVHLKINCLKCFFLLQHTHLSCVCCEKQSEKGHK